MLNVYFILCNMKVRLNTSHSVRFKIKSEYFICAMQMFRGISPCASQMLKCIQHCNSNIKVNTHPYCAIQM